MFKKKAPDPVILGMNPPTKELVLCRGNRILKGFDLLIFHAKFPKGTKPGDPATEPTERTGLAAWLHFTDAEDMEKFGNEIVDFAKSMEKKK